MPYMDGVGLCIEHFEITSTHFQKLTWKMMFLLQEMMFSFESLYHSEKSRCHTWMLQEVTKWLVNGL